MADAEKVYDAIDRNQFPEQDILWGVWEGVGQIKYIISHRWKDARYTNWPRTLVGTGVVLLSLGEAYAMKLAWDLGISTSTLGEQVRNPAVIAALSLTAIGLLCAQEKATNTRMKKQDEFASYVRSVNRNMSGDLQGDTLDRVDEMVDRLISYGVSDQNAHDIGRMMISDGKTRQGLIDARILNVVGGDPHSLEHLAHRGYVTKGQVIVDSAYFYSKKGNRAVDNDRIRETLEQLEKTQNQS